MGNRIHNLSYLKERRRSLRKNLTKAEAYLWRLLKSKPCGKKFRRQHSIANYIVDFYCASEKLIIELDGEIHKNLGQANTDHERDRVLKGLGFTILRFENKLVFNQPDVVIDIIQSHYSSK